MKIEKIMKDLDMLKILDAYRCQYQRDDLGGSQLTDVLTPSFAKDVGLGIQEKEYLADYLHACIHNHIREWLKSAELFHISDIVSCDACGDTGLTIHFVPSPDKDRGYFGENGELVEPVDCVCDCLKNPMYLASIKQRVGG